MADTLKCPNCGAPLDYSGSDPIIRCPYCSTSVVVPDNLRAKPAFSDKPHNFTLSGSPDMASLVQKARRIKEVKDLARSGQTEQAISIYREVMDVSRADAEAAVQALAQGQPIVFSSMTSTTPAQVLQSSAAAADLVNQSQRYNQGASIETSATSSSSRMGCVVGCLITAIALGIVGLIAIPIFLSSGGLAMINNLTGLGIPSFTFASQELAFGSKGTGPGLFTDLRAVAANPATGAIFASDYEGGRVQAFDPTGKFLTEWTVGKGNKDTIITGMAADRNGNVFIASGGGVLRYNASGKLLNTLQVPDENFVNDVAVGADGTLVLGCDNDVIATMTPQGDVINIIKGAFANNGGDDELDMRVAVDGSGNIYALGTFNNAVFKFNRQGKFINRFGTEGDNPGEFTAPYAIAVDGFGRVFVSDFKGVQAFDSQGRYLNVFDPGGAVFGLAVDDQGNLYVGTNNETFYKFMIQQPSSGQ